MTGQDSRTGCLAWPGLADRRRVTTRAEAGRVALDLFASQGFERTTVDDIARAAGIGRRTFFRYFHSKNDVPRGDFDAELARMGAVLNATPEGVPLIDAIRRAVAEFNRGRGSTCPGTGGGWSRKRMGQRQHR